MLLLGLLVLVRGQGFVNIENRWNVSFRALVVDDVPTAEFRLSARTQGWVAVGFAPTNREAHVNTDMISCHVFTDGRVELFDRNSQTFSTPLPDVRNQLTLVDASMGNGVTLCVFRRPINTSDVQDQVLLTNVSTSILWAYGWGDAFQQHNLTNRGRVNLRLFGGSVTVSERPVDLSAGSFSSPDGRFFLFWRTSSSGVWDVTMQGNTTGWIGFGIQRGMNAHDDSDMIQCAVTSAGIGIIVDGYSRSFVQPIADRQNDVDLVDFSEVSGSTSCSFKRRFETGDSEDINIPLGNVRFVWAISSSDDFGISHTNQTRGTGVADFRLGNPLIDRFPSDNAAIEYMIVVLSFVGVYSFFHLTHLCFKKCRRVPKQGPVMIMESSGVHVHSDVSQPISDSTEYSSPISGNVAHPIYYRGSQAIPYNPNHKSEDESGDLSSADSTPDLLLSLPKSENRIPLLFNEKRRKGPFQNVFFRALHRRIMWTQMSVMDTIIIGFIVFINLGFLFLWPNPDWKFAETWGYLAIANSVLVAVPSARNSFMSLFLGIPFEKALLYHKWLGRIIFVEVTVHLVLYQVSWMQEGSTALMMRQSRRPTTGFGIISWICLIPVFLSSLGCFRRKYFNLFYLLHFLFLGYYVLGALHTRVFRFYAIVAGIVYVLDMMIRLVFGGMPSTCHSLTVFPGNVVRIRFKRNRFNPKRQKVGNYVFVNFPQISLHEWHPFTLVNGPNESEYEIAVKVLGDHSQKIMRTAKEFKKITLRADGPYGHWPFDFLRFRQVIFVCAGIGAASGISALRHLYRFNASQMMKDFPVVQHVTFVWVAQTEESYLWFQEALEHAFEKQGKDGFPRLRAEVLVTRASGTSNPHLKVGKPDLLKIFDEAMLEVPSAKRIAVIANGPRTLTNEVWDFCCRMTRKDVRVDFHHEIFEI